MNRSGTIVTPRSPDEVFDLLANPGQFAPLLPNFESVTLLDPTHFLLRIAIAIGEMSGHANLDMELVEAERAVTVGYCGQGIVAGSQLRFALEYRITPVNASTELSWRGDFSLTGGLALMMASFIEAMGRKHFDELAATLREKLNAVEPPSSLPSPDSEP